MIRTLTLAAFAAAMIAAPASAQTVRIPVAGKSTEQLNAEIAKAVTSVCREAAATATMQLEAYVRCVRLSNKDVQAQLAGTPSTRQLAQR